ncbi:hypothetical protein [Terrimonas alba]|uniref:hypothetical protein n=1 Tax=Terrimonas alba TaxID=3349636 RepID=UPI0035F483B5
MEHKGRKEYTRNATRCKQIANTLCPSWAVVFVVLLYAFEKLDGMAIYRSGIINKNIHQTL